MKPGFFQGKKFPFTPKRRKKSLGSQCNNIIDTRHDLAAFRSKLANVSWLRSYSHHGVHFPPASPVRWSLSGKPHIRQHRHNAGGGLCPTFGFLYVHKLYLKSATVHTAVCPSCTCSPAHVTPYVDLFVIMRNARLLAANSFARPCNYEANPRYCTFANCCSTPCREHSTCLYLCTVLLLRLLHET